MTKKEKEELVWRLKDRPTAEGVSRLVEQGIITADQARDILFSKPVEKNNNEENKALKEQVKFLQDLVDRLVSERRSIAVPYTYTTKTPLVYWNNLTTYSSGTSNSKYYIGDDHTITMTVA